MIVGSQNVSTITVFAASVRRKQVLNSSYNVYVARLQKHWLYYKDARCEEDGKSFPKPKRNSKVMLHTIGVHNRLSFCELDILVIPGYQPPRYMKRYIARIPPRPGPCAGEARGESKLCIRHATLRSLSWLMNSGGKKNKRQGGTRVASASGAKAKRKSRKDWAKCKGLGPVICAFAKRRMCIHRV